MIGAAALGLDPLREGRRWMVDLHVIEPFRRRGVARAMLNRVIAAAAAHGIDSLHAWGWLIPDSPPARVWTALGFSVSRRRHDFEVDLNAAMDILTPLLERARRRIPTGARIIPLADADLEAVARLHEAHLGGNRRVLWPLLTGTVSNRYDPRVSVVLLLDDQVVGAALARLTSDGVSEVDAKVLHPTVRRSWANVWLMHDGIRRAVEQGTRVMRYFTLDQHEDTRQLSARLGGKLTGSSVWVSRQLQPATSTHDRADGSHGAEE